MQSKPARPPYIPAALDHGLHDLADWLASLESVLSSGARAAPERARELNERFARLWEAAGMDASLGLARSTPDHRRFRKMLGASFWQSPQLRRCFDKPRGYAGDFIMMDAICNRAPAAETALGQWLENWFLEDFPGTRSVRNRRDFMAGLLVSEHARGARRVLNVAAGGAPELSRLPPELRFDEIVLLDQDAEALAFAQQSVSARDAARPAPLPVRTVCTPIQNLLRDPAALGREPFDVIYSMGLYDYLPQDRAAALTATLWSALAPRGILVIGNYQGHHWGRYVVEAVMEWFLIYRDEDELLSLAAGLAGAKASVTTEATGLVHLLHVRKPS